jgi:hypothetical protein
VKKATNALDQLIRNADASTSGKGMLAAILTEWGGVAALAAEIRQEFVDLPPGHPARAKLHALLLQAILRFGGEGEDDEDLDAAEEELLETEREIAELPDDTKPE